MERLGVDLDSNSLIESIHPYTSYDPANNGSFGVMYNLFKPGNNFNLSLVESDSSNSADPIRADCSLNNGVALAYCSPKDETFRELSERSSVNVQTEDSIANLANYSENHALNEYGACNLQNFEPNICQSYAMKTSCLNVDLVSDNLTLDNIDYDRHIDIEDHVDKDHSSPYSETHIPQSDVESELKQSESLDVKPVSTVPFITMENSNNAIDNNLHVNATNLLISSTDNNSKNHIFKLPNKELTFNGTLKHLQKLQPIVNVDVKNDYIQDNQKYDTVEYYPYKSSDELTNSSPSTSVCSSKSGMFSSTSQFPSDCDAISNEHSVQKSDNDFGLVGEYKDEVIEKNFTFAGTVSPLKSKVVITKDVTNTNSHNKSNESCNSLYEGGPQSPNMFSDDEEEYSEEKLEKEKLAETLIKFEECDSNLIRLLERTLQGVLPPPSITICQLTVNEILDRYKENLERFEMSQNTRSGGSSSYPFDPETSASMTPPRCINTDNTTLEPSLSNSIAVAFENTLAADHSMSCNNQSEGDKPCNNILFINGTEDIATNEDWPHIMNYRFHGVHYNSSHHSETIDCLLSRYASRYVGCETASSCITIPMTVGTGYRGMVRRQHPSTAGAPSPSRRLSHLARRRAAFCTAASLSLPMNRARQILIDRKYFTHRKFGSCSRTRRTPGKKTPGRKTPSKRTPGKKTPAKKTPGKKTPSSSQKKAAAKRLGLCGEVRVKSQPTRETSKRALFLSPDNVPRVEVQPDLTKPSTSKVLKSKRALFGSPNKGSFDESKLTKSDSKATNSTFHRSNLSTFTDVGKKRPREDSFDDFVPSTKLPKSLSFGGDKIAGMTNDTPRMLTRRATEFISSRSELSDIHKKKLLWAVAETLRSHGIGMSHESFKQHATSLVRLTRKLCTLPTNVRALKTPFSSTSDTLLKIARLHAYSVIKGKSVDELFEEEQRKQMNTSATKVTGYVPLSYYETSNRLQLSSTTTMDKNSENSYGEVKMVKNDTVSASKKTVLQDKLVNIDTNSGGEVDIKKPAICRDVDNKLRARRQISFDNMEPSKR